VKKKYDRKSLQEFKKILLKKKEELNEQIEHISSDAKKTQKEASGDISGYSFHMADVATDNYDREFNLELASNEREILYEIDQALSRIAEGNFGLCEKCNKPISKVRLKAVPQARLCINCQEAHEKKI